MNLVPLIPKGCIDMTATTRTLDVTGMHCHSCAALIDESVADLPGVSAVSTSRAENTSTVTFDDAEVSVEQIVKAIAEAGYTAAVRP